MTRCDQGTRGVRRSTLVTATSVPEGTVVLDQDVVRRSQVETDGQAVIGMHDQFDVTLEDADLLGEVELTTNLIIAASEADGRLTDEEIDRILGVAHE